MSGGVAISEHTEIPVSEARTTPRTGFNLLQSEPAILTAMLIALGIFYLGPGFISIVIGVISFFALTVYRPDLSLAMVPLAAPLFYRPRTISSNYYFSLAEVIIICGVAAWIARDGWSLARTRKMPNVASLKKEPGVLLAAALGIIGILWLLIPPTADLRKIALREFRWTVLEPLLFFGMMLRWLRTERDVWRMVGAWLVAAALVGREGAEQFFFGQTWSMEGVGRVTSIYPSATAFGIYMGRALPMALTLAIFLPARWRLWRVGAGLLSISMALGVLFSFARAAWIGVFVAMLAVALVTFDKRLLVALGVAVLGGLAALPFLKIERITSMFDFSTPDNTGVSRLKIWSAALRVLKDHPFTGIGQDQFLYVDPKYEVPNVRFLTISHPHNWIFDFWLRLGVPGLAWLLVVLGYFGWVSLRLWKACRGTALGALVLGLLASMIDFAVHGLMDMAYFTMDLALTFWLTVGLLVVIKLMSDKTVLHSLHTGIRQETGKG